MSLSGTFSQTVSISGGGTTASLAAELGISTANNTASFGLNCATAQTGQSNTFVGNYASVNSVSGAGDTVIGFDAAPNLAGDNNVLIGALAATALTTGGRNVVVGASGAPSLVAASGNVSVGASSDVGSVNGIAVGAGAASMAVGAVAVGAGARAYGASGVAVGQGATAAWGGSFDVAGRLLGYFSPPGTTSATATYAVQAVADVLKLVGGASLAFCASTGGVGVDPDASWAVAPLGADLAFTSSNGAVVRLVDDFRPGVLDFTAQHRCELAAAFQEASPAAFPLLPMAGRVVVATGRYRSTASGPGVVTADEAVPVVELSTVARPMDPRAFGVLSAEPASADYRLGHLAFASRVGDPSIVVVNSGGEGGVWVSDERGPLRVGDLVTTGSEVPGVAVRQDDDLVRSCTVAKVTCDCDFDGVAPGPVVRLPEGIRACLLGCVYA